MFSLAGILRLPAPYATVHPAAILRRWWYSDAGRKSQEEIQVKETIMKLRMLFCAAIACPLALVAGQGQSKPVPTTPASDIPHLRKQGTATQLIVDGKPFLALAGELRNNSATSVEHMQP